MKNKGIICLICVFIMIFSALCAGCGKKEAVGKGEKPLIGISMCSLLVERWYKDRDAFQAELSRLGADVIIQNANNDADLQASQINDLIDKGVDALIVTPIKSSAITESILRAKKLGIAVIAYERLVESTEIDAYYSFDNVRVGELLALGLLSSLKSGNIMIINGDKNDHNTTLYQTGYMNILKPHIENGSINIVGESYCENWETEYAYSAVESALNSGIKVDGIIATNDSLAGSAIQALSEKGIAGAAVVVGQDGDLAAYQRIVEGVQAATVYKNYTKLASAAALAAVRLAQGKPFAFSTTIDNGTGEVKYYKLKPSLVTKDNLEESVIEGGVYSREEVYMNVIE